MTAREDQAARYWPTAAAYAINLSRGACGHVPVRARRAVRAGREAVVVTITDANALNIVLRYLLGLDAQISDDKAREAAARLAGRANKVLGAGLTAEQVEEAWQHVIVCPAQDGA